MEKEIVQGLVSTIIPVHNRPVLLREAVASVIAQTYRPIEVIIVDDGSTDETLEVASRLVGLHPRELKLFSQENQGPGSARETGRRAALGEFIQYLDSDDIVLPRKFELQVAGLRSCSDCGAAYGMTRCYSFDETPVDVACKRTGEKIPTMFPAFLKSRWWSTSTPMFRRHLTDRAGPWTTLSNEEDWEYDCRIASLGVKLYWVSEFVSDTRRNLASTLSRNGASDPRKLRDRARAHQMIYRHAVSAHMDTESSEMQHFARELFLLARQCGAAGLPEDARMLFCLSREASGSTRRDRMQFRLYEMLARFLGWSRLGWLACELDKWRP